LFDIAVGHAGDVVGDGAGESLGGDLPLVVLGQLGGIGDECGKQSFDNLGGVGVGLLHAGRVVEVGVENSLAAARAASTGGLRATRRRGALRISARVAAPRAATPVRTSCNRSVTNKFKTRLSA